MPLGQLYAFFNVLSKRRGELSQPHRIVTQLSQLRDLASWPAILMKSNPITLRVPGMTEQDALALQSLINQRLSACGCTEGAMFLFVGTCSYIAYLVFVGKGGMAWSTLWIGLGVACTAATLGKVVGLIRSQLLLNTLIRRIVANPRLST